MAVARKSRAGIIAPGSVPTLPVEVDWSHPLANGLIACYVPGGARGLVDLAGAGPTISMSSGAKLAPTTSGAGLVTTVSSSVASSPTVPNQWLLSNSGTLFLSSDFYGTPGGGNGILWGLFHSSANVSPFTDYLLFVDFGTKQSGLSYSSAGVANTALSGTLAPTSGRHSLAATFAMGGGAISFYHDGAPVGSTTWGGAQPSYGSPVVALGGNPTVSAKTNNTGIAVALTYNRALSASEVAILSRDPMCMLRPVRRPSYKAPATTSLALSSVGAGFAHGRGALSLSQGLASYGSAFAQGRGPLSFNLGLASIASARAHGRGALLLNLALTGRGAAFARGRSALTLLTPLALQSAGSGRSAGRGSLTLLLPLSARGASVGRGRGILTITGTLLALTSRGAAFSRSRSSISLGVLVALHASRGQAFSHGGALRGGPAGIGVLTLTPFVPSQNVINIGMPQRGLPIADPKTGQMNQNWYLFFHALWQRGGGPIGN